MTASVEQRITEILSDGKFHSGEQIAGRLGISRTSVWKKIQSVKDRYGLEIHAVTGKGYWLPQGMDLLSETVIRDELLQNSQPDLSFVRVFDRVASTNQYLLECDEVSSDGFAVCLAEMQTQGRGRRGRQWLSPFGRNIHLSVACQLNMPMTRVAGLSIAVGVAVADSVAQLGLSQVALKWPNDIHVNEQKLAGMLVEIKGEAEGPVKTVVGIGLNVELPGKLSAGIDQPVTDLANNVTGELPMRNIVAATLIEHVCQAVKQFTANGLNEFIQRWSKYDLYLGKKVVLKSASFQVEGIYRGLDATGGLLLENQQGIAVYNAGEVSMRGGEVQG